MTFEPFHCTFVGDARGFQVTPEEGTLNRRGGDPQELDVSYKGNVSTLRESFIKVRGSLASNIHRKGMLHWVASLGRRVGECRSNLQHYHPKTFSMTKPRLQYAGLFSHKSGSVLL